MIEWGRGRATRQSREAHQVAAAVAKRHHRFICQRARGYLANRSTGESYPAPCKAWRVCAQCARAYGRMLSERWSKVTKLAAFVVLTMPPGIREQWRDPGAIAAMMKAWRRLYERLVRLFGRRPKLMHFKEHAGQHGGLHLNVLWDWEFIDQRELSRLAAASGFGPICHISAIGNSRRELTRGRVGSSAAVRYSVKEGFKVKAYARKTGGETRSGDDWPSKTRRWSSSRAASTEMGKREPNPDWYWTPGNQGTVEAPRSSFYLLPEPYLPTRPEKPQPRLPRAQFKLHL